jgi:hypothetical protein
MPEPSSPTPTSFYPDARTASEDNWKIHKAYDKTISTITSPTPAPHTAYVPFLNVCASSNPQDWVTEFEERTWSPLRKIPSPQLRGGIAMTPFSLYF